MSFLKACVNVLGVPHGRLGLTLIAVCWPLNWLLQGVRTAFLFFLLWLGYILTADALVLGRRGSSLWTHSRRNFVRLFLASAPGWWLFELINCRTQNWEYLGAERFSDLAYFLLCTISFSTVMPAVFETAELVRTFGWLERLPSGPRLQLTKPAARGLLLTGVLMLTMILAWPRYFYPLVWLSVFLILEPLNIWFGRPHLFQSLELGDWRPLLSLSLGAVICGFFWELWNFHSYPKWIYHTPGVEFLRLFEMPLLGYGGYIFFAWELHALRNFLWPGAPALRL